MVFLGLTCLIFQIFPVLKFLKVLGALRIQGLNPFCPGAFKMCTQYGCQKKFPENVSLRSKLVIIKRGKVIIVHYKNYVDITHFLSYTKLK